MGQGTQDRRASYLLALIIAIYLVLGTLYAVLTPDWQAPDEPAHYNYVVYLAEQHRFPVLKPGDYPAAYLEEIKAAHFPPEMSIAPIRYEFHQPPLHYILALPIYSLSGGALVPLRLLSVAMGGLLLLLVYWIVQALSPERPHLALGATSFVAFLPMHLAMTASLNNDILAEVLLAVVLLLTIRYLRRSVDETASSLDTRLLVLLGITTGLCLVTKSSVYFALPLVLVAIIARHLWLEREEPPLSTTAKAIGIYLLPALGLALPWWLRNMALYGGLDWLGLGRHNEVVAGQLRTAEFVAQHGFARLIQDFSLTSFRSFWGQFGWMGVLLDTRLYQAMAILSALALLGFFLWAGRAWRNRDTIPAWKWAAGGVLALVGLFTLATYLWYNIGFLQHQGRYLFRALIPISVVVALGWREILRQQRAWLIAAVLLASAALLKIIGLLPNWPLLMTVVTAIAFGIRRFLPEKWNPLVQTTPYLLLILFSLLSLFLFIIPQLT
jgi:4-amino-4-deoxy-L-arabinose transferase-like glycosyltransferase